MYSSLYQRTIRHQRTTQGAAGTLRTLQAERAFRPAFTPASIQRDGFDGGARRTPLDLSGGVKAKYSAQQAVASHPGPSFSASLDDLASVF